MITEPELTGGFGESEPIGDVLSDADRPPADDVAADRRRPWKWAAGGVLVASAVWATGLYAYHHSGHDGFPDQHGYHAGTSPCSLPTLKPLTDAIGDPAPGASPTGLLHGPAVDRTMCSLSARSPVTNGWLTAYEGNITFELHKKTDPRAEFEDGDRLYDDTLTPVADLKTVPGLGDEAYLLAISDQSEELKVLHGGAVLTITLTGYTTWLGPSAPRPADAEPPLPELTRLQPALLDTARQILSALRR